jgi:hypothetical protein
VDQPTKLGFTTVAATSVAGGWCHRLLIPTQAQSGSAYQGFLAALRNDNRTHQDDTGVTSLKYPFFLDSEVII